MDIYILKTPEDIAKAYSTFLELRPHLTNKDSFITQVLEQQKQGYEIRAIVQNDEVVACIGFRTITTLAWGKITYIDDLITKEKERSKGYGRILLEHIVEIARDGLCKEVHLDTGYARHAAHRLYLKQGFELVCHHLSLKL